MRRFLAETSVWALGGAMVLGGCKSSPAPAPAAPAATTQAQQPMAVRNPDGSITNPDGSVTFPAGSPQARQAEAAISASGGTTTSGARRNPDGSVTFPAGTAPAVAAQPVQNAQRTTEAPAPARQAAPAQQAPAPVERKAVVVPAGARVSVSLSQTLSARDNNVGDSFSGVLARPLTTSGGAVAFPRGTRVEGTVVAAKGRGRFAGSGDLGIQLTSIAGQHVQTSEYEKESKGRGKRTGAFIGGGGGLGALIGGLAGGGKGALIGGLAGAGAGTAASAYTGNRNVVIPAESIVSFRLNEALRGE